MPDGSPQNRQLAAKIGAEFVRRLLDFMPEAKLQMERSVKSKFHCGISRLR